MAKKTKCDKCGRQMHRADSQLWGAKLNLLRYICPQGHVKFIKV